MKRTLLLLALATGCAVPSLARAQDRVGYANLDVIISQMPESKNVSAQLEGYQDELAKGLRTKQEYAQQKFAEARGAQEAGVVSEAKLQEYKDELGRLEREIQEFAADADQKLLDKRTELMVPLVEKLQETIEQVASAQGYTHVINMTDGTGTSVVLWAIEERDLTEEILSALGVTVPEESEEEASG